MNIIIELFLRGRGASDLEEWQALQQGTELLRVPLSQEVHSRQESREASVGLWLAVSWHRAYWALWLNMCDCHSRREWLWGAHSRAT